jgi:hypothetical protein
VLLVALVVFGRRKGRRQAEEIVASRRFVLDAGLDFACLPDDWPAMARETLNAAGAHQVVSLPVVLAVNGDVLTIEKKRVLGGGKTPFRAEVALADIDSVEIGKSQRAVGGSSLYLGLAGDGWLSADISVAMDEAEPIAQALRRHVRDADRRPARGIVVLSEPPPLRTPSGLAGGLLMACFVPFAVAMVGAEKGGYAAASTLGLLFYALWLMLRRPPTMATRLAIVSPVVAIAFVADAFVTGELWRLGGAAVSIALIAGLLIVKPPSRAS